MAKGTLQTIDLLEIYVHGYAGRSRGALRRVCAWTARRYGSIWPGCVDDHVDVARTRSNTLAIPPRRSTSRSSMLSALARIPATTLAAFAFRVR